MRRSIYLALVLAIFLIVGAALPIWAQANIQGVSSYVFTDANGDGFISFNDTIQLTVVATYSVGDAWTTLPSVDLSAIGGNSEEMLARVGDSSTYRGFFTLNNWQTTTPNGVPANLIVYASTNNAGPGLLAEDFQIVTTQIVDIVRVAGANPKVVSTNTLPNFVTQNDTITITIDDNNYQSTPLGGTIATVDLTALDNTITTPTTMTFLGTGSFELVDFAPGDGIDFTGELSISLKDPIYPAETFLTNTIIVDTVPPTVISAGTNFESGIALSGNTLILTAGVTLYDGETVKVQCPLLTTGIPDISTEHTMTKNGNPSKGDPASWSTNIILSPGFLKNDSLPITFIFTDDAGNSSQIIKNIAIDLETPAFTSLTVDVLYDDSSSTSYNVATTTCKIKLLANIPINAGPDSITVTADLSSIGGNASTTMNKIGATDDYECIYTIIDGTLEDDIKHAFNVEAVDAAGNPFAQATSPEIAVDNSPPVVTGAIDITTIPDDSKIVAGDLFKISLNITGVENGTVTVDLSPIGMSANTIIEPEYVGSENYSASFVLPAASSPAFVHRAYTKFDVNVTDTVINPDVSETLEGNLLNRKTAEIWFDNNPISIVATHTNTYHVLQPLLDNGAIRVGDYLSFHVEIASIAVGVTPTVTIDLSEIGMSSSEPMIASPSFDGWFDYVINSVPVGTINDLEKTVVIRVVDEYGNVSLAPIPVQIDNQPVEVASVQISPSDIINLNKSLDVKIVLASPTLDAFATATIDLTAIGIPSGEELDIDASSENYVSAGIITTETTTDTSVNFQAFVYDNAGNLTVAQSSDREVDCFPPSISTATVSIVGGVEPAAINTILKFYAEVKDNESIAPTIDLTSIGGLVSQPMDYEGASTSFGVSKYKFDATVATGSIDQSLASWTITVWDNALNSASASTNEISVDNLPPQGNVIVVTGAVSPIKLGDTVTFTITDTSNTSIATIDLTSLGGSSNEAMIPGVNDFSIIFPVNPLNQAIAAYPSHVFTALLTDPNGNTLIATSSVSYDVDCQATSFFNEGIFISQDNGDNPFLSIGNVNDILTVYTSASAYTDASITAIIASNGVDIATATMEYNSALNRHEANFTVRCPGDGGWMNLNNTDIDFRFNATDTVGNVSTSSTWYSTFTIKNATPSISLVDTSLTLDPDITVAAAGGLQVYNVASFSPVDILTADIKLENNEPIHKAWLDFSDLGIADVDLVSSSDSATTDTGIIATTLPPIDFEEKTIRIVVQGLGGQTASYSEQFYIDNVPPTIAISTFDGASLTVTISEPIDMSSVNVDQWKIVGSSTSGTPVSLPLSTDPADLTTNTSSFNVALTVAQQKEIVQWASTPIYLQVTNADIPLIDVAENWLEPIGFSPITITDSTWREEPRIIQVKMIENWPNSIIIDVTFNKDMDTPSAIYPVSPTNLIASSVVLLTSNYSDYEFYHPNYRVGYILQETDIIMWQSPTRLQIEMSKDGMDWIAAKVTNNPSVKLKFATRSTNHIFTYDILGKKMVPILPTSPMDAIDSPNNPRLADIIHVTSPVINVADKTLVLTMDDRVRLFTNDFNTDLGTNPALAPANPKMASPTLTLDKAVTTFHRRITLYNDYYNVATSDKVDLVLEDLEIPSEISTTTVTLKLTDEDVANIFNLKANIATPFWGAHVQEGIFHGWWGTPNKAYLTSGPGGMLAPEFPLSADVDAASAACSMSDKPPFNQHVAGDLIFEVEITLPKAGSAEVPIQTQIEPTARIISQDDSTIITTGDFISWTNRVVDEENRAVVRFSNLTSFPPSLQNIPVKIEVNGITDILGGVYNVVASYAYDLNTKDDSVAQGFTDPASAPITIDTQDPLVTSVSPTGIVNLLPDKSEFIVTFDEDMDTSSTPGLSLATTSQTLNFTFTGWGSTRTASFTNNTAFTSATTNGTWTYKASGYDLASNLVNGATAYQLQIRTKAPEISTIELKTIQDIISTTQTLTNQPWSAEIPSLTSYFAIKYTEIPTLLHTFELFDSDGQLLVSSPVSVADASTMMATVTFVLADFAVNPGAIGPVSYNAKVIDPLGNETSLFGDYVYDSLAPEIATHSFTNVGSQTTDIIYYNANSDFSFDINTIAGTDTLKLAFCNDTPATTTYSFSQSPAGGTSYNISLGNSLLDASYKMTVLDLAGNISTFSKTLVVDSVAPEVSAITPLTIGIADVNSQQFDVVFNEPMDTINLATPSLELASGTVIISTTFDTWVNLTTARFINSTAIVATMPTGIYTYRVTNGRDLAYNILNSPADMDFPVSIYTDGPVAKITNLTLQSHLYDLATSSLDFNPAFGDASATLQINYDSELYDTPHDLLIYNSLNVNVGTYTGLTNASNQEIHITGVDGEAGWTFDPSPLVDDEYRFVIQDNSGNRISGYYDYPLTIDTASPTVTAIEMIGIDGIATDTGFGDMLYYSSIIGNATFKITANSTDNLRLVVASLTSPATYVVDLTRSGSDHTCVFGSVLAEGFYNVTATDLAGNLATGSASTSIMIVDNTRPTVTVASPTISGGYPAGVGVFDITFDEAMNTGVPPTLTIATTSHVIPMTFERWIDSLTCRFTNTNAINATLPNGTYNYQIVDAKDLAGNSNVNPASAPISASFPVQLFTQGPKFSAKLRSVQPLVSTNTILIDQPFSAIGPSVATLTITYNEGPFQTPHHLILYGDSNVEVTNIVVPVATIASITVDASFFGIATSPVVCSYKLVDKIGNESAIYPIKITYDNISPVISTATVSTVSNASSTPMYYNPQLHGDLNVALLTDAIDTLRLTIATSTATNTYPMTSSFFSPTTKTVNIPVSETSTYPDDEYIINSFDLAGNKGTGSASNLRIIFDTVPATLSASVADPIALSTGATLNNAGPRLATFTVTFNEAMNQLVSASPVFTLATTTHSIQFELASWTTTNIAQFVNTNAIPSTIPQGDYTVSISCHDVTGNYAELKSIATFSVITREPVVTAVFHSMQPLLSTATVLINKPFSINVGAGVGKSIITYDEMPVRTPHSVQVYNPEDILVASVALTVNATSSFAVVDTDFFSNKIPPALAPGNIGPVTYSYRVRDTIGNESAPNYIVYDAKAPSIATTTVTNVSIATDTYLYYNPALHGDLNVYMETDATDSLILTIATTTVSPTATQTYSMSSDGVGNHSCKISQMLASETFVDGDYVINAFDLAGNPGVGLGSNKVIVFDTIPPQVALTGAGVASVTVAGGIPINTAEIGQASITVEFSEPMAQIPSLAPVLTLATSTHNIEFALATWTSPTEAIFNNITAITPDVPQGDYVCDIFCYDITGNYAELASVTTIPIESNGPDVMSIVTISQQYTTASDSSELKIDMPFSLALNPDGATMSVQLNSVPDATPTHILFTQNDVMQASYPIVFDALNMATFNWTLGTPPSSLTANITYVVRFTDDDGDYSLQSYEWTMDPIAPVITSQPTITGGEVATVAVYYNPLRHGNLTANFAAAEIQTPILRVQGENSTDTYQMVSAGTELWSGAYDGRYSRGGTPKAFVSNGTYTMSLVDWAGNVGVASNGVAAVATFVIDTDFPQISTYSISVNGTSVTKYAPGAGHLEITVDSPEMLSMTGIYWLKVFNSSGASIKKVPLSASGSLYVADWDGTNNSGITIDGGSYKLQASDYAGNLATGSLWIDTFTSPFKVISVNQLSTSTVKIWFNQKLDTSSVSIASVTVTDTIVGNTDLTVSNITLAESQSITMTLNSAMTNAVNYTFTVATGSVKSEYGVGISGPANSASFVADAAGPIVTDVSFDGANGPSQFRVNYNEVFDATMASNIANYTLVGPSGAISVSSAVPQSGHKSVLITASSDLIDKQSYTITVSGIEDELGNVTVSNKTFTGRDLTPPTFEIGVFSNPTNENDIIVVVSTNEQLQNIPSLLITQNGTRAISAVLQQGYASNTYMIGAHLSPNYPGNGIIEVSGVDETGNSGSGSVAFSVAVVASKRASNMFSADKHTMLSFNESSLNADAMVKIFSHKLISDTSGKSSVKTSMRSIYANILGNVRASEITSSDIVGVGQLELIPISKAYEVGVSANKIAGDFKLMMATNATASVGVGLFRQDGDKWTFISKSKTSNNNYYASIKQAGMYAALLDVVAPVITFAPELDTSEPFKTDQPEFTGTIVENGSGLDKTSVKAYVDNGPAQSVIVNADNSFVFKTMAQLTGGMHTLIIKANDNTGNQAPSPEIRFEVVVPLTITQIVQYPNPARRKMFVRISANRGDITEDLVRVRIYDTAGHKVTTLDGIRPVREIWGLNSRYLYDIPWDLRNKDGRTVANGVYFAKVEIRDPDDPSKKTKRMQKLAVLR